MSPWEFWESAFAPFGRDHVAAVLSWDQVQGSGCRCAPVPISKALSSHSFGQPQMCASFHFRLTHQPFFCVSCVRSICSKHRAAVCLHVHVWNSLKPSRHSDGHFMFHLVDWLPLGTDASPLHFPLQSLASDVASAGNEQLGVDVFLHCFVYFSS